MDSAHLIAKDMEVLTTVLNKGSGALHSPHIYSLCGGWKTGDGLERGDNAGGILPKDRKLNKRYCP